MILHHKLKHGMTDRPRRTTRLPRVVEAYGAELNQVWTNLIDNAIDALAATGVTIRTAGEGEGVVEIADDGPGMPPGCGRGCSSPSSPPRRSARAPASGSTSPGGSSSRHHGELRLSPQPGDTRFQVRLPVGGREVLNKKAFWRSKANVGGFPRPAGPPRLTLSPVKTC